ncbi:MAG: HipA N-terminal domain-containing protein [Coriobacteriales bacterium]|jgi:serine/threonine-protein kinase HipA|nr:HipA N-terminal domain-containing protein [Coriobacteriales bacterium]
MKNDADLFIYRSDRFVGTLSAPLDDEFSFVYDSEYCASGGVPLSLALPLREEPVVGNVVYAYFDGLLPEGTERESLARYLQVSPLNTGEMLAALGGECIGDVVILTERLQELGYRNIDSGYQALDEETFWALVGPAPEIRLATEVANRISLAGAQSKIGLYYAYPTEDTSNDPLSDQLDGHVKRQNNIKRCGLSCSTI